MDKTKLITFRAATIPRYGSGGLCEHMQEAAEETKRRGVSVLGGQTHSKCEACRNARA